MQNGNLKKNDQVKVIAGKDKGKNGKVIKLLADKDRVVVEKVNLIKRHQKPDQKSKGGIIEKEASIHVSNLMYLCPKCNKASRVGVRALQDGSKSRVCKKCKELLDA